MGVSAGCWLAPAGARAADTNQLSPEFVRQVLDRLQKDEAEIQELKAALARQTPAAPAGANAPAAEFQQRLATDETALKNLRAELDAKNNSDSAVKYPNLQFHGFGDIDYAADNRRGQENFGVTTYGGKNSFYLGELDLFVTSQLAQDVSILNETVLAAGADNHMTIDIERLYLEYRANDAFIIDAGRFHTALGYYNTAYHHGAWLQNAVGRPSFLQYEDSGGILPVHMVGLSVHGAIPSGKMNLTYFAEVGNGSEYSISGVNPVQNIFDNTDSKAVNVAIISKPEWLPGFQFGGGVYYDQITPDLSASLDPSLLPAGVVPPASLPRNNQFIYNAHAVYHNSLWEILNEGYLISDTPIGGETHYTPCFFTQVSRKVDQFTPYARFTYYNASRNDPLYTYAWDGGQNSGVHYGPSLGLRYDFSNYAAIKAQYDYLIDTGLNDASRITMQAAFTF
jgi:hypothetical protein